MLFLFSEALVMLCWFVVTVQSLQAQSTASLLGSPAGFYIPELWWQCRQCVLVPQLYCHKKLYYHSSCIWAPELTTDQITTAIYKSREPTGNSHPAFQHRPAHCFVLLTLAALVEFVGGDQNAKWVLKWEWILDSHSSKGHKNDSKWIIMLYLDV